MLVLWSGVMMCLLAEIVACVSVLQCRPQQEKANALFRATGPQQLR